MAKKDPFSARRENPQHALTAKVGMLFNKAKKGMEIYKTSGSGKRSFRAMNFF
jgi:hypothetical protein